MLVSEQICLSEYVFLEHVQRSWSMRLYQLAEKHKEGWQQQLLGFPAQRLSKWIEQGGEPKFHVNLKYHGKWVPVEYVSPSFDWVPSAGNVFIQKPDLIVLLYKLLSVEGVYIDIGSENGSALLPLLGSSCFDGKILAFESVKSRYAALSQVLNQLKAGENVSLYSIKLADISRGGETPQMSLDAFAKTEKINHIDFIRVNAPNAEVAIFQGATQVLQTLRPYIYFENWRALSEQMQMHLYTMFNKMGYALYVPAWLCHQAKGWHVQNTPAGLNDTQRLCLLDWTESPQRLYDTETIQDLHFLAAPVEKQHELKRKFDKMGASLKYEQTDYC